MSSKRIVVKLNEREFPINVEVLDVGSLSICAICRPIFHLGIQDIVEQKTFALMLNYCNIYEPGA